MDDYSYTPRAREQGLLIEPLEDELLVFDSDSNRAHALNPTVTNVWRACDGSRDIAALETECGLDPDALQLALDMLHEARLLDEPDDPDRVSRRVMLRKSLAAGAAMGAAVPAIHSITAPTPAMAASAATVDLVISPGVYQGTNGLGGKDYRYDAGLVVCRSNEVTVTHTFTVTNHGTATSDTLTVHGFFSNDNCSGHALGPGEKCTVDLSWLVPCNPGVNEFSHSPALVVDSTTGPYIDLTAAVETVEA